MFSTRIAGWIALAASVLFLFLIVFQAAELMYYRAAPSVWPAP